MDLDIPNHTEATSSSTQPAHPTPSTSIATTDLTRVLRSTTRVKTNKQLKTTAQDTQSSTDRNPVAGSSTSSVRSPKLKRQRSEGEGKTINQETAEESVSRSSKRTRRNNTHTTESSQRDIKGKGRALPEEEDTQPTPSTSRQTRTPYLLRNTTQMPKKSKSSPIKGKAALKAKSTVASGSRLHDEDVDMADTHDRSDIEDAGMADPSDDMCDDDVDTSHNGNQPEHDDSDSQSDEDNLPPPPAPPVMDAPTSQNMDESPAMAIFGDYRHIGSYMMGLSSRLKSILNNIKPSADPTTRLLTLQELSELLSFSTEDTLAGSFPVESFVRELVRILGGSGADDDDDDEGGDDADHNEDAALAAALAMSAGGGDENLEAQVLACRCLANLMEALPGVAHTVVYHGAIPVLCSKLIEISYIDLAEQTLSTLEKISEEFPSAIVREGGLAALLNYLDFFSIAVQRTAVQAAANCCRNLSPDYFTMIQGVWSIIRNCLSYPDQRLLEFACLCIIRVIDSYHRSGVEHLEVLVDADLVRAVNQLLLPAGGSPLIAATTYTQLVRALATAARASPAVAVTMLKTDMADTLYQILTGVLPPQENHLAAEQGGAEGGQGLGGGVADMTVMDNLAHRPKDQIEEALSLVSELMPPLPKDGVFDYKSYTEKAISRLIKAKTKAERAAARQAAHAELLVGTFIASVPPSASETPRTDSPLPPAEIISPEQSGDSLALMSQERPPDRTDLLRGEIVVVSRFMRLMVPILVDVYAATVITPVRIKALNGLLKAVSFLAPQELVEVLNSVPVASFASAILSTKDHPTLVIGALQLVELLLSKVPELYAPTFRREGVFHEIEQFAKRDLASSKYQDKDKDSSQDSSSSQSQAGLKRLTTLTIDPEDAITLRARIVRMKYLSSGDKEESDGDLASLRRLVEGLAITSANEEHIAAHLKEIADLFSSSRTSISSFELLQSGIVDGLLKFATSENWTIDLQRRQELLYQAFTSDLSKQRSSSAFAILVKKLQESLTKIEPFQVVSVSQSSDDSKRSSPSLLARQMRLRLVADEDSDIPSNLHNIVVSIHAIATFQALHDYLRPRVSGLLSGSGSRLTSMLAALAGARLAAASSSAGHRLPEPSSASAPLARRRSSRLNPKESGSLSAPTSGEEPEPSTPSLLAEAQPAPTEPLAGDSEFNGDFTDDELDAEVVEDNEDVTEPVTEKTVMVSVADDGSKVVANTPDGTRVATPSAAARNVGSSSSISYAAAVKTSPSDWHLEFTMDDHPLPLDLTIYGAIHQAEARKKSVVSPSLLWQGVYTVKFKKVAGPLPQSDTRDGTDKPRAPLSSLPADAPHTQTMRLLSVLHKLNEQELADAPFHATVSDSAFVNNKLTAKLTRQLEEPMIVASSCLPEWAMDLPIHFPFLFPFSTRYNFLQSTSFGYARLILKWQSQQARSQDSSRRDDNIGFLGRLQRQKVRISRKHILESAVKVFELYGSSSSILEVEYFEEVGTGLGPTLEFYSLVSQEFARKDLKIWRDADPSGPGHFVHHPAGLYPSPLCPDETVPNGGHKRNHILRIVGQFVAKAMLDSRIVDMTFNKVFLKQILGIPVPSTLATLKMVDSRLADSLQKLQHLATNESVTSIDDLALDFTLPGYDIELLPGGRDITVTAQNVQQYIDLVVDSIVGKGSFLQAQAFREGFSRVFPVSDLQAFSVQELAMLFGNSEEDWSVETLSESIKADHGFSIESRAIRDLIDIISSYKTNERRSFLQFITGSPKLPIGGFRGLNPPLTVVRKPHEPPLKADDYLPSVMTCVNYLKLPEYSSKDSMRGKLRTAMQEGVGSFHLS